MVTITRGLLSVLCERAVAGDPESVTVALDTTPADELVGVEAEVDAETPVLTHFYLPEAGASVSAVFGMDLSRPSGSGLFVSHPDGRQGLSETDDLAGVVLVATPPYDLEDVRAYDRRGRRQPLEVTDATPPEERLDDAAAAPGEEPADDAAPAERRPSDAEPSEAGHDESDPTAANDE
ncbi:hypothetical protein RYH80_10125 [Halobaculum sp. MBLA0147]|uniref:hypothetical protein n=1 Tax=Halobaculum sp. MBLA0147 TaxID=3079934 RepID=UPI0035242FAA